MAEVLASYALAALADVKVYLDIPEEDAEHDDLLVRLINTGSSMMFGVSGRTFIGPLAEDRWFEVPAGARSFRIDDCSVVHAISLYEHGGVGAAIIGSPWTTAQWAAWPLSRPYPWSPIERIQAVGWGAAGVGWGGVVKVNADWGFPEVPEDVREAVVQHVALAYARNVQRFSGVINLDTGRVEIPRALAASSRDVALRFKRRSV